MGPVSGRVAGASFLLAAGRFKMSGLKRSRRERKPQRRGGSADEKKQLCKLPFYRARIGSFRHPERLHAGREGTEAFGQRCCATRPEAAETITNDFGYGQGDAASERAGGGLELGGDG